MRWLAHHPSSCLHHSHANRCSACAKRSEPYQTRQLQDADAAPIPLCDDRQTGRPHTGELAMSTVFPDTATLCKSGAAVIARSSALATAVGDEVRIIRRYVLWEVVIAFLF